MEGGSRLVGVLGEISGFGRYEGEFASGWVLQNLGTVSSLSNGTRNRAIFDHKMWWRCRWRHLDLAVEVVSGELVGLAVDQEGGLDSFRISVPSASYAEFPLSFQIGYFHIQGCMDSLSRGLGAGAGAGAVVRLSPAVG